MCGIFSILNCPKIFANILEAFEKGKSRGPENSQIDIFLNSIILGFHRLAINGQSIIDNQPINVSNCVLICNGEIYNYTYLYSLFKHNKFTKNDCEIIIHMYKHFGIKETLNLIDGVFAFVLLDIEKRCIYVARDTFGVRPLFKLTKKETASCGFVSEMKMAVSLTPDKLIPFKPGTYSKFNLKFLKKMQKWLWVPAFENKIFSTKNSSIDYSIFSVDDAYLKISKALEKAVEKRVTSTDRPIACLLSGGLDSSLIAALVQRYYTKNLETFSIGLKGSEDIKYARIVAKFLKTKHTEIILTEQQFLDAIPETIYAIESYDTTTVRASVGNYLVSKYIKTHSEAKVVFNGDGSDEVCGGYLYFHAAPNSIEFNKECIRLLNDIYAFDVLRSDRCTSCHGLEPRTPFLDKSFVYTYLSIPPHLRAHNALGQCEKFLLRNSFKKLLPKEILFRKKEAFSDGVSNISRSWYAIIQSYIRKNKTIQKNIKSNIIFKYNKWNFPKTDEQKYYRYLFNKHYMQFPQVIPYFWMPKFIAAGDASARTLDIYNPEKSKAEEKIFISRTTLQNEILRLKKELENEKIKARKAIGLKAPLKLVSRPSHTIPARTPEVDPTTASMTLAVPRHSPRTARRIPQRAPQSALRQPITQEKNFDIFGKSRKQIKNNSSSKKFFCDNCEKEGLSVCWKCEIKRMNQA